MQVTIDNIENFIHYFMDRNDTFNDFKWVEPIFVSMIRAYQNDEKISIATDNAYIRSMILNDHKPHKTYSPVENVSSRNGLESISKHLADIMLQNFSKLSPSDQKELGNYLQYLFLELMNNVSDHSESPVGGYVMAQYFPVKRKIQFAVADRGIGFLENIQLKFHEISNEKEAIHKALEKGVTSTKPKMYGHERNAGFGLYAMFKILQMTGGKFIIISNDTLIHYHDENYTTKKLSEPWKGVVVAFEFDQSYIAHNMDDFKRMFLWDEVLEDDEDFF
jgi:hypothetical protein